MYMMALINSYDSVGLIHKMKQCFLNSSWCSDFPCLIKLRVQAGTGFPMINTALLFVYLLLSILSCPSFLTPPPGGVFPRSPPGDVGGALLIATCYPVEM